MSKNKGLNRTLEWFETAIPEPTAKNQSVQLGCHFEEIAEMLETLSSDDVVGKIMLCRAFDAVTTVAENLKKDTGYIYLPEENAVAFLDSLVDQLVTGTGTGHMYSMDILNALDEVNRSNWSKFEDGKPVFFENGKLGKGKFYSEPNLVPYVTLDIFRT